jgi:hypothetical protein
MLYEIVNPSDPYVMEADDRAVACAAGLILGEGAYALKAEGASGADLALPIFIFGGAVEWFNETFPTPLESFVPANSKAIAAALETVTIGKFDDYHRLRRAAEALPEDARAAFLTSWHDDKRSSLNNIGRRAKAIAKGLIEKYGDQP